MGEPGEATGLGVGFGLWGLRLSGRQEWVLADQFGALRLIVGWCLGRGEKLGRW